MKGKWIMWGLQWILGGLFIFAGVEKLSDPALFVFNIRAYQFTWLHDPAPAILAVGLPWLEIFCGLALIVNRLKSGALVLLIGMISVFSVAVSSAWYRGLDIECGCFGGGKKTGDYLPHLIQNGLILAGLVAVLWLVLKTPRSQAIGQVE